MARKRYTTEQIIGLLREAEVRLSQGQKIGTICRSIGVSEQSYYRWRREYGGLKLDQAKRLKDLDRENERLKRAVSELTLDKGGVEILEDFFENSAILTLKCDESCLRKSGWTVPLGWSRMVLSFARTFGGCNR